MTYRTPLKPGNAHRRIRDRARRAAQIGRGSLKKPVDYDNLVYLTPPDPINPAHYHGDSIMRIIEEFKAGFCAGNIVKYVLRAKEKNGVEDLKKARWYLERLIATEEGK